MDLNHDQAGDLIGAGSKETIRAGDLDQDTVKAGTEVTVYSKQVAQDQVLFHGYGVRNREFAEAFVSLDLVATGNEAAAAAGDPIDGDIVLAITDSEGQRVLASVTFESVEELRDAANETRSDRVIEPALAPYATPGRNLEVRIEADSASDGYELDPSASSGKLYYGKVQG